MSGLIVVAPLVLDDVDAPGGSYRDEPAGSAAYAALSARHFARTSIAAIVGDDFPSDLAARFPGVDLSRVEHVAGPSFRWTGGHHADGSTVTVRNDPGATRSRLPVLGELREAYVLVGALAPNLQERVRPARFLAIDTMPCYIDEDASRLRRAMAGADLALLTVAEAERLVGEREPDAVRRALGVDILVLKDGPNGALVSWRDELRRVPAYPTRVVDPTGAGDAFAGAFVATLAERDARDADVLQLAARRGAAAASIAVEDLGPRALARAGTWLIEQRAGELARREVLA